MPLWTRVSYAGRECFGTVAGDTMCCTRRHVCESACDPESRSAQRGRVDADNAEQNAGARRQLSRARNQAWSRRTPEPLYFLKASNSFLAAGEPIRTPQAYAGKVVFEGELGIVIGKHCRALDEVDAASYIFGYTCVNDVTAAEILNKDPGFAQWTRAKSFDTFGVFGPVIATDVDPSKLVVRTILNDQERQNYPVADAIFAPAKLVSLISRDLTLEPGDVIACGTSVGVGSMKPGSVISIVIDGIGTLTNRFE